jgi:hypothetical protein
MRYEDVSPLLKGLFLILGPGKHPTQGDWRKGSADIKILLKNLYSQPSMSHTDVIFKVCALLTYDVILRNYVIIIKGKGT